MAAAITMPAALALTSMPLSPALLRLAGEELLADYGAYDNASGSYWSVVASNVRQRNHIKRLQLRTRVRASAYARLLACTSACWRSSCACVTGCAC